MDGICEAPWLRGEGEERGEWKENGEGRGTRTLAARFGPRQEKEGPGDRSNGEELLVIPRDRAEAVALAPAGTGTRRRAHAGGGGRERCQAWETGAGFTGDNGATGGGANRRSSLSIPDRASREALGHGHAGARGAGLRLPVGSRGSRSLGRWLRLRVAAEIKELVGAIWLGGWGL